MFSAGLRSLRTAAKQQPLMRSAMRNMSHDAKHAMGAPHALLPSPPCARAWRCAVIPSSCTHPPRSSRAHGGVRLSLFVHPLTPLLSRTAEMVKWKRISLFAFPGSLGYAAYVMATMEHEHYEQVRAARTARCVFEPSAAALPRRLPGQLPAQSCIAGSRSASARALQSTTVQAALGCRTDPRPAPLIWFSSALLRLAASACLHRHARQAAPVDGAPLPRSPVVVLVVVLAAAEAHALPSCACMHASAPPSR